MIGVADAYRWLNFETPSHLSDASSFSVWQIQDARVTDAEMNAMIESLLHCSRDLASALERAEIMAICAVARFEQEQREEARRLMLEAFRIYSEQKDHHRQAVVEWCLFIMRRVLLENSRAFSHARSARTLFNEQAAHYVLMGEKEAQRIRWYRERVMDMTCDLMMTPEEGFEWINQFHGTRLNTAAQQLRDEIRTLIEDKCFDDAYQQMERLRKITMKSPDSLETAEALAFCGLATVEMGNRSEGIHDLRAAQANAIPASHEHTAIRWMLGIVQYHLLAERNKGINNLEDCMRFFNDLQKQARQKDNKKAQAWYEAQIDAMHRVMKDLVHSEE